MLTIHTADELRISWDADPLKDGAVAVEGDRVAGTGPLDVLLERFPGARVRSWPGTSGRRSSTRTHCRRHRRHGNVFTPF